MSTGYFIDFIGKDNTFDWIQKSNTNVFMANMANTGNKKWRDEWTDNGYVIGNRSGLAFNPSDHSIEKTTPNYDNAWDFVLELTKSSDWSTLSDLEKAKRILGSSTQANQGAFLYPASQLTAPEGTPGKKGGYCFWAQDLEADATVAANSTQAKAQFAGIIAVLWAG